MDVVITSGVNKARFLMFQLHIAHFYPNSTVSCEEGAAQKLWGCYF